MLGIYHLLEICWASPNLLTPIFPGFITACTVQPNGLTFVSRHSHLLSQTDAIPSGQYLQQSILILHLDRASHLSVPLLFFKNFYKLLALAVTEILNSKGRIWSQQEVDLIFVSECCDHETRSLCVPTLALILGMFNLPAWFSQGSCMVVGLLC